MNDTLHTKYRPQSFDDVVGQDAVVASIRKALAKKLSRTLVFIGPFGTGKTTLARLVAKEIGCLPQNITELDAATFNGVDDMRNLTSTAHYSGLGKNPARCNILDEVHLLSKSAWSALLKITEEPPSHLWWMLCTTDAGKIPANIASRCVKFHLNPVDEEEIVKVLDGINEAEGLGAKDDVIHICAEKAYGSVRGGITNLALCAACKTRKEAARMLRESASSDGGDAYQFAQALMKGVNGWPHAMKIAAPLKELKAESVRMTVVGYFTTALLGCKSDQQAQRMLAVLNAFRDPYPPEAGVYPILLSLGDLLYE